MELELRALRAQLMEKSKHSLRLQKEVCLLFFTMFAGFGFNVYELVKYFWPNVCFYMLSLLVAHVFSCII